MNEFKTMPRPVLTEKSGKKVVGGREVTFPVSYRYNGGTIIGNEWYQGYEVPQPKLPKGHKLQTLGVGLQLNAKPPYATMLMVKK